MLRPSNVLIVPLDDLADHEVTALRSAISELVTRYHAGSTVPDAISGWTGQLATELFRRLLAANRSVQASVLVQAAHNGGGCDRDTVYRLGGYDETRRLNGFTKPVRRIMREMQAEGLLAVDAADPMVPVYDAQNASYQRAEGFQMPSELVPVFADALRLPDAA